MCAGNPSRSTAGRVITLKVNCLQILFSIIGSAWECHPGCRRFCLSSCKRSCCAPGAPSYTPDMFPQLVSYQASLPPPPPPPPACPTGCPSTCYPSCDSGCCFPVNQAPVYPQYSANPYSAGYGGYPTDPCAAQGCSAECAPLCKPGKHSYYSSFVRSVSPLISISSFLLASLMLASTLFSTIAGKSQNLSDVRSEASAVDLFSYYRGYSLMCENQQQNLNSRQFWHL